MTNVDVNNFKEEKKCVYKNETYSVRDNGAVLRHPKLNSRQKRKNDNTWTFGKVNNKTGYMEIASKRIHRIVATAFHGKTPTAQHIVDHIDTNRQNNRPNNLRWITKLENIILNPITCKKIEKRCGCSIEEVLKDISILQKQTLPTEFSWMGTVSQKEADESLNRWLKWVKSPLETNAGMQLFEKGVRKSKTYGAAQRNWYPSGEFPCCPQEKGEKPLEGYLNNIKIGAIFYKNHKYEHKVIDASISDDGNELYVKCVVEGAIKPFILATVTYENDWYVHSCSRYFDPSSMEKYFTLGLGQEWTGGDVFDDYC